MSYHFLIIQGKDRSEKYFLPPRDDETMIEPIVTNIAADKRVTTDPSSPSSDDSCFM